MDAAVVVVPKSDETDNFDDIEACPQCHQQVPSGHAICPYCGYPEK